jgi:hypothetical protein
MEIFRTLYGFELKKLFQRKLTLVTLAVMVVLTVLSAGSELLYSNLSLEQGEMVSGATYIAEEKRIKQALSGRALDDELLAEMQDAFSDRSFELRQEESGTDVVSVTMSGNPTAAHAAYYPIYWEALTIWRGDEAATLTSDAASLYAKRAATLADTWEEDGLTDAEIARLEEEEDQLTTPWVFAYCDGWDQLLEVVQTLQMLAVFLVAICLGGIFSDEQLRRTDQLTLSTRFGRTTLLGAKLLAGMTFAVGAVVVMAALAMAVVAGLYGLDGFDAAIQWSLTYASCNLTMGGAVLRLLGMMLLATVLHGAVTMALSQWLRSSVAAMAIPVGVTVASMLVYVPWRFRTANMLCSLLPVNLVSSAAFLDNRLYPFSLTRLQTGAVVYPVLIAAALVGIKAAYGSVRRS